MSQYDDALQALADQQNAIGQLQQSADAVDIATTQVADRVAAIPAGPDLGPVLQLIQSNTTGIQNVKQQLDTTKVHLDQIAT